MINQIRSIEVHVAIARNFVPAHHLGIYRQSLTTLLSSVDELRLVIAPRKKFRFTRSVPAKSGLDAVAAELNAFRAAVEQEAHKTAQGARDVISHCGVTGKELRISGLTNVRLIIAPGELEGRDISFEQLENCEIIVLDQAGAIRASRLKDCALTFVAVCSSALLYFLDRCEIALSVRQLRVHDSNDLIFRVCTRSSPVIERSRRIIMSPYDIKGLEVNGDATCLQSMWESSTLETPDEEKILKGPWRDVKDFDWIKMEQSPHWDVHNSVDENAIRTFKVKIRVEDGNVRPHVHIEVNKGAEKHDGQVICDRDLCPLSQLSGTNMDASIDIENVLRHANQKPVVVYEYLSPLLFSPQQWQEEILSKRVKSGSTIISTSSLTANPSADLTGKQKVLTIEQARRQAMEKVLAMSMEVSEDLDQNKKKIASSQPTKLVDGTSSSVAGYVKQTNVKTPSLELKTSIVDVKNKNILEITSKLSVTEEWPDEF